MDCNKNPNDTIQDQEVDVYLIDLKDRFEDVHMQFQEVMEKSIKIVNEIDKASSGFGLDESRSNSKIKDLIRGFEKSTGNFEERSEKNDVLKKSLIHLKRAKDSLDCVDLYLKGLTGKVKLNSEKYDHLKQNYCHKFGKYEYCMSNGDAELSQPMFSSCLSSSTSLNMFQSVEDFKDALGSESFYDIGYQGDIDESEYDLHANKKNLNITEACDM